DVVTHDEDDVGLLDCGHWGSSSRCVLGQCAPPGPSQERRPLRPTTHALPEKFMREMPLSERGGLVRTRLALERTLLAWLRTAIAMITFGFTLFKAVEYAHQLGLKRTEGLLGTHSFARIMIVLGLLALILATIQHIRHARTLRQLDAELP